MTSANSLTSAYISLGLFTFIYFSLVVPQTGTTTISLFCTHLDFRVCILLSLFRSRVLNKEPCNDRSCGQFVWKDFHKLLGSYNSSSLCQRIRPRGQFSWIQIDISGSFDASASCRYSYSHFQGTEVFPDLHLAAILLVIMVYLKGSWLETSPTAVAHVLISDV
jgi:hypothetical protein